MKSCIVLSNEVISYEAHSHELFPCSITLDNLECHDNSFTGAIPTELNGIASLSTFRSHVCPTGLSSSFSFSLAANMEMYNNLYTVGGFTCAVPITTCLVSCSDPGNPSCRHFSASPICRFTSPLSGT